MIDWGLRLLNSAQRYLKRLPQPDQERIVRSLKLLCADPQQVDIKPLKGRPELRLRVGNYRVLFLIDSENKLYIVTKIGPRGDVYK